MEIGMCGRKLIYSYSYIGRCVVAQEWEGGRECTVIFLVANDLAILKMLLTDQ